MRCQAAPNIHLCLCHDLLWLLLSVTEQTAWLPGSQVPWKPPSTTIPSHHHPFPPLSLPTPSHSPILLYTTLVILQKVFKNLGYSTTYQLCSCNASYKTDVLLVQIWCGYIQSSFSQLQCLEYFKFGFLEIQSWSVFLNPVTFTEI